VGASGAACGARAGVSQRSAAQFPWYLPRRVASHFVPSHALLTRALSLLTISAAADTSSDRSSNPNASLVWFWPPAFRISRMFPARS
jgi:hypothetical protein